MNKSSMIILGILTAVLGAAAIGWGSISYTTRDTVVDVGSLRVIADNKRDIPLSPILGGIVLAGGAGLILIGVRK